MKIEKVERITLTEEEYEQIHSIMNSIDKLAYECKNEENIDAVFNVSDAIKHFLEIAEVE